MSTGETLIALGGLALVVVVDIIGDLIADEYGISSLYWGLGIAAVLLVWGRHFRHSTTFAPYDKLMVFVGYGGLVLGIRELLADWNFGFPSGWGLFFALVGYVAAALMGYGAYEMSHSG